MRRALVVGGTGPTGPFIVKGLRARGYAVSIFHRGTHEIAEIPADVEHVHGDPHFRETIDEALAGRRFELVIASYGRVRLLAEALVGRAERFVAVGGFGTYRGALNPEASFPAGLAVPVPEDAPLVASETEQRFAWLMAKTEEAVMACHPTAALFRYPYVYGPYQVVPREWCVIRRILDGRKRLLLPDGGLVLTTHGYAENVAEAVLLAVDRPEASAGRIYNCGDERQLSLVQIATIIAAEMGRTVEIVSLPHALAFPAHPFALGGTHHRLLDLGRLKQDLGYRDVVAPDEALRRTTRWLVANRPEPGGELEQRLGDRFDYATEDALMDRFGAFLCAAGDLLARKPQIGHHPYAHPTEANRARDHRNR